MNYNAVMNMICRKYLRECSETFAVDSVLFSVYLIFNTILFSVFLAKPYLLHLT